MDRDKVQRMFIDLLWGNRDEIKFSKGYEVFEEEYKYNKEYLKREEIDHFGWCEVIIKKK